MSINFEYDLTELNNFVDQSRFREEIELWYFHGEPNKVHIVFDSDGVMFLVVPEYENATKCLCIKMIEASELANG